MPERNKSIFGWLWGLGIVVVAVSLTSPAAAATIAVTATSDDVIVNGNCTLREAIIAANGNAAVDACSAGSGVDIVDLPAGTYTLAISGVAENASATGDLDITDDLTLRGETSGPTIIDGGAIDTVIEIDPNKMGIEVTIIGLQIRNGKAPPTGANLEFVGGGIRNFASLTLDDTNVSNSSADRGGGIYNEGVLVMFRSSLLENFAPTGGGGLSSEGGSVLLERSIVAANSSSNGGGIDNGAELRIFDSTIAENSAQSRGGGINNSGGTVTIGASVISDNNGGNGGAIFNIIGSTTLTNVTLSGNNRTSKGLGGGIYSTSGSSNLSTTLRLTNTTITDNDGGGLLLNGSAHTAMAVNTIVADNRPDDCSPAGAMLTSLGHNLDSDGSCISGGVNGDVTSAQAGLASLADNGGFTQTHALRDDSPAIDAGTNQGCPIDDQRHTERPLDGDANGTAVCDIGAYERQSDRIFNSSFES